MKRASYLLIAGVFALLAMPGPASARYIVAGPGATLSNYAGVVFVEAGNGLEFANGDIDQHDVISFGLRPQGDPAPHCVNYGSGQCPLFRTDLIGLAQVDEVDGVEDLPTGLYDFFCSFHEWMQATLVVI